MNADQNLIVKIGRAEISTNPLVYTVRTVYSQGMTTRELGLREARSNLGQIANTAHLRRDVTYLTRNGERIAAIVPVTETEATETRFAVPADEDARIGTITTLRLMRTLADGIIGLQVGSVTIDDLTDDLNATMKRLANKDGELSESATLAATALYRALNQAINENL